MNYKPYISEYASFSWFRLSWFFDESLKSKQLSILLGPAHRVGQVFFSYILNDTGGFITRSSVIPIDEHELTTNHITKQCNNFMEHVEAKIGNDKQPLFDGTKPDIVYYSAFGDTNYAEDNMVPYGKDIQDQKEVEVNES